MNIAIVAVFVPQVKNLIDKPIKRLFIIDTDEYGSDDYRIIKAVEEKLIEEFKIKPLTKLPTGIRMNIVKRDTIDGPNLSADEICTNFLVDKIFGKYM